MPYPTYPIVQDESEAVVGAGIQAVRATNGMLKRRRLYSADKADFTIVHILGRADRDTLLAFWEANKDANFDFRWPVDGATYTCGFVDKPQVSPRTAYYHVTVRLAQV